MKKEKYSYRSLQERLRQEYKLYLLAFVFIVIADGIGVIKLPIWKGTFILFPIFYAILMGVCAGPVSYTHLDVYKRQQYSILIGKAFQFFI